MNMVSKKKWCLILFIIISLFVQCQKNFDVGLYYEEVNLKENNYISLFLDSILTTDYFNEQYVEIRCDSNGFNIEICQYKEIRYMKDLFIRRGDYVLFYAGNIIVIDNCNEYLFENNFMPLGTIIKVPLCTENDIEYENKKEKIPKEYHFFIPVQ